MAYMSQRNANGVTDMTKQEINAQYDEMIAEITGSSAQHQATRAMIDGWRKEALKDAADE